MKMLVSIGQGYGLRVQLHQLAYFVAVAETKHFTRAAARVHVAQPSLSAQIRALETELGSPLFNRARGNITLTAAGEALLPLARKILADADLARREVQELTDLRRGTVRIGATPSLCTGMLPEVLRLFRQRYPGIRLIVEEGGSRDLVGELAVGALDLALIILPLQGNDPALATAPLLREDLVVISSPDGPPPVRGARMAVEDLRDRPLVMFRRGYDLRDFTVGACRASGFESTFAIEGGEMDAVCGFVMAGLGIAVIPSMVAFRQPLRTTPFAAPGLHRTIGLAHRRDVEPPRAARELRATLVDFVVNAAAADMLPPGVRPAPGVTDVARPKTQPSATGPTVPTSPPAGPTDQTPYPFDR